MYNTDTHKMFQNINFKPASFQRNGFLIQHLIENNLLDAQSDPNEESVSRREHYTIRKLHLCKVWLRHGMYNLFIIVLHVT
jgi:hypothetical protein